MSSSNCIVIFDVLKSSGSRTRMLITVIIFVNWHKLRVPRSLCVPTGTITKRDLVLFRVNLGIYDAYTLSKVPRGMVRSTGSGLFSSIDPIGIFMVKIEYLLISEMLVL